MPMHAPKAGLATHEVTNQPPDYHGVNFYLRDAAMREAAEREGGPWVAEPLAALGAVVGAEETLALGAEANRNPPALAAFDRQGRRIDEARFHPAYHALTALAMRHRIHSVAWLERRAGAHVLHAALLALFTQAEAGVMCPISMTYASVPALRRAPGIAARWTPKILGDEYDPELRPVGEKKSAMIGMAMTEKQGGSDVRANATRAVAAGEPGAYRLTGHKWFCSAPMSDAFLTLAQTDRGLSCFLVPRICPDGERNAIHLMRLKDKLGNRSNASAEIEYHGAHAELVGEEGRGVATIIEMVHHTRLDTMAGSLGIMRRALAEAVHHACHRRAFQKRLIDQALMRSVLAELAIDYEAAAALVMRVARGFDGAGQSEAAFSRLAVAVGKFCLAKRTPHFVYECMECLGGGGYVEEGPMPRLYREAPLNAIWEGSGNVIALDILRTLAREPMARDAFLAELHCARGAHSGLDAACAELEEELARQPAESDARRLAERMGLLLQAALLARFAPRPVADAFMAARLGSRWTAQYGAAALPPATVDALIDRLTA